MINNQSTPGCRGNAEQIYRAHRFERRLPPRLSDSAFLRAGRRATAGRAVLAISPNCPLLGSFIRLSLTFKALGAGRDEPHQLRLCQNLQSGYVVMPSNSGVQQGLRRACPCHDLPSARPLICVIAWGCWLGSPDCNHCCCRAPFAPAPSSRHRAGPRNSHSAAQPLKRRFDPFICLVVVSVKAASAQSCAGKELQVSPPRASGKVRIASGLAPPGERLARRFVLRLLHTTQHRITISSPAVATAASPAAPRNLSALSTLPR